MNKTVRSLPEVDGHEELVVCTVPKRIGGRTTGAAEKRPMLHGCGVCASGVARARVGGKKSRPSRPSVHSRAQVVKEKRMAV